MYLNQDFECPECGETNEVRFDVDSWDSWKDRENIECTCGCTFEGIIDVSVDIEVSTKILTPRGKKFDPDDLDTYAVKPAENQIAAFDTSPFHVLNNPVKSK